MKIQDSSNLNVILQNNFGAIIFALFIVLYHIFKTYYKTLKKKLSIQFNKYTSAHIDIQSLTASLEGTDTHYVRIRHFGGSYVIINNVELAAKIIENPDIFENATFTSHTFNLSLNLLGILHEKKNFKKFLNVVLRERNTNDDPKNSIEYPIQSNELFGQTNIVIPAASANNRKKPWWPKLYPSLATNETNDTETRLREEFPFNSAASEKSTSKMDTNMELLLPERFVEQKENRALKECNYNISQPFTLMKAQTDHSASSNTQVMNSNNTLITQKSPTLNANEKSIHKQQPAFATSPQIESSIRLANHCIKELIVLLEAKSNRRDTVDINFFSYRYAVNTLGVCLFGKQISELSGSRCQFYQICDDIVGILRDQQRNKIVQYLNDLSQLFQSFRQQDERIRRIVRFYNCAVDECLTGHYEGHENSLINVLLQPFVKDFLSQNNDNEITKLKGSISAFLISFTINVLEILSGSFSLIMYKLAKDVELQEKIRTSDKVEFNLEGFPLFNFQTSIKCTTGLIDSIVKEALATHAVDPITPFICKYPYRIPETKILVNPTCVILVPRQVFPNSQQQIDCEGKWPEQGTPSGGFTIDLETKSFNLFVEQFVEICLKLSVTSLLQEYYFTVKNTRNDRDDEVASSTCCRFTTLPGEIYLNVGRVDKLGKVIAFEESLKAFHAMKNAPLVPWRTIWTKCFPNTVAMSS